MKALKIKEGIYWVGAIDWNIRNFHGYSTPRGTTYNAYLIIDEKITLIDTVKPTKTNEMMERIESVIDPSKIDYLVSNHSELDHSGSIPAIIEKAPNVKIVAAEKSGINGLKKHFKKDWNFKGMKTGDILNIGKRNLHFTQTPMVHWPDNMVAYLAEEKILFSNDSLGQHYATSERFDDEAPLDIVMEEAKKYYANIVLPYSMQVKKELEALGGLDIELVATSHGVMWRKHIGKIISQYKKWSNNETTKKAIIAYDTMWGSTEKMAIAIQGAFEDAGYKVFLRNLQFSHHSDIMTEIIDAEYVCVGSPNLNKGMVPLVSGFLSYMCGLTPKNRKAIVFGSYGWAKQNIKQMQEKLLSGGFDVKETFEHNFVPGKEDLDKIKIRMAEILS